MLINQLKSHALLAATAWLALSLTAHAQEPAVSFVFQDSDKESKSDVLQPSDSSPLSPLPEKETLPLVEQQPLIVEPALPRTTQGGMTQNPFVTALGARAATALTLQSLTPYMIGDGQVGGCGSVSFLPDSFVNIEHPTFSCIRANVAENNSPLPRNRIYARYNHFENITTTSFFPTIRPAESATANLPIERFTLGFEKTIFNDNFSFEGRFPFAYELSSDLYIARSADVPGDPLPGSTVADNLPLDAMAWEMGNISFLAKYLVHQTPEVAFSIGAALNVPTGDDVDVAIYLDDPAFPIEILPGVPLFTIPAELNLQASVKNETFNFSPFMAGLWTPSENYFVQGFCQFDFPLNESNAIGVGTGSVNGVELDLFDTNIEGGQKIQQQTLMRLSGGIGWWLFRDRNQNFIRNMAYMLEMHYTTTLTDAKLVEFDVPLPIPFIDADVSVGNLANRNDILNMTNGVVMEVGENQMVSAGLVVPLRTGTDKPFDFELNLYLTQGY